MKTFQEKLESVKQSYRDILEMFQFEFEIVPLFSSKICNGVETVVADIENTGFSTVFHMNLNEKTLIIKQLRQALKDDASDEDVAQFNQQAKKRK